MSVDTISQKRIKNKLKRTRKPTEPYFVDPLLASGEFYLKSS